MTNKEKIKALVVEMLNESHTKSLKKIDDVLKSGCIDTENWNGTMILPKTIVTAILESESRQYDGKGTCFEKEAKKGVKNILYFI